MNDLDLFGEPIPVASLGELATAINAEHQAAERTARTALDHARAAGEKLLLAKAQVEHGQWLPWLSAHCPDVAVRTAQAYMRLAGNWGTLEAKYADSAYLSIDAALKLLNAPEPDPDPITGDLLSADDPALAEPVTPPAPLVYPDWNAGQLERRLRVEQGFAVVASKRNGADAALIAWASQQGLMTPVDRSSAWGNPFEMPADGDRNAVCDRFAEFLTAKPALLKKITMLKGKVLVCWCHPERCHGDHLAALANEETPAPVVSAEPKQQAVPDPTPAPKPDSGGNDEWYTPGEYIEAAREVMGRIDLDPASCEVAQATVKAVRFFTKESGRTGATLGGECLVKPTVLERLNRLVYRQGAD